MSTFNVVKDSSHSYLCGDIRTNECSLEMKPAQKDRVLILPVRTTLTDLLIGKRATQDPAEHAGMAEGFQRLIQSVHQRIEELQGIVLLSEIHWFSP